MLHQTCLRLWLRNAGGQLQSVPCTWPGWDIWAHFSTRRVRHAEAPQMLNCTCGKSSHETRSQTSGQAPCQTRVQALNGRGGRTLEPLGEVSAMQSRQLTHQPRAYSCLGRSRGSDREYSPGKSQRSHCREGMGIYTKNRVRHWMMG